MNFDQSGLPPIQLIQDAYDFSYAFLMSLKNEEMKNFERQITRMFRENLGMLQEEKRRTKMSDEEFQKELADLQQMRQQQMQAGPRLIQNELDRRFRVTHLRPALELFQHADQASPETMAAVLLVECVRSPRDFRRIEATFGPVVADILADMLHIENYQFDRAQNLAAASEQAKRGYTALTIASLENISDRAEVFAKRNPGQRMVFPEGQEQQIFANTQSVWGTDAKLQDRMVEAFNKTAAAVLSKFRLQKDPQGALALVPYAPPKPPSTNVPAIRPKPPKNGGGDGSIGGDVF